MDTYWERISELDDLSTESSKNKKEEQKLKKKKKSRRGSQGLRGSYKSCNIYMMGISEGEGVEKGTEGIFEIIMTKSFSKLMSDTKLQI